jgi:hypothetical protein
VTAADLGRILGLWLVGASQVAAQPLDAPPVDCAAVRAERDALATEVQLLRARIRGLELSARAVESSDCSTASALSCAACVAAVGAGVLLGAER